MRAIPLYCLWRSLWPDFFNRLECETAQVDVDDVIAITGPLYCLWRSLWPDFFNRLECETAQVDVDDVIAITGQVFT
jgi:hypothetical protein